MNEIPFSTTIINELSGVTKVQRDEWSKALWVYLDQNPGSGEILRRWRKAGCDPRNVAMAIHRYVIGYSSKLQVFQRKDRKEKAKKILTAALPSLRDLETLYRVYDQVGAASRISRTRMVANSLRRGQVKRTMHKRKVPAMKVSRSDEKSL